MKKGILFIFIIIQINLAGQTSRSVDSAIVITALNLDSLNSTCIMTIYNSFYKYGLYDRLDTIKYDFAIIEVSMVDTSIRIDEYYYFGKDSKYQLIVYFDGKRNNYDDFIGKYNYTILKTKINKIKPIQELNYEKTQNIFSGDLYRSPKKTMKWRENLLKKKYQIQIYINPNNNIIKTSLQTHPKKVSFKIKNHGLSF